MLNNILLFVGITLMYSTPLAFAALGGVISERSGVTNLGLEGMMTIGAFTGAALGYFTGSPWLGFFAAGAAGGDPRGARGEIRRRAALRTVARLPRRRHAAAPPREARLRAR